MTSTTIYAYSFTNFVKSSFRFVVVKDIICGAVRCIYRRLRTHKVQFIAMQVNDVMQEVDFEIIMKLHCDVLQ